jgi:hypothetical protein
MAAIEQETQRQKSRAEAEAKALEKKLSEDVNRRMLIEKANAEREKWVQAINATFEHIGGMPYQVAISMCLFISSDLFYYKPLVHVIYPMSNNWINHS